MLTPRTLNAILVTLLLFSANSYSANYTIAVPPLLSHDESIRRYEPLLRYLDDKTGEHFELVTTINFMGYWQAMRKQDAFDFFFDGSHLAAYRVERRHQRYVARLDGVVSYSLITRGEDLLMEPDELLKRHIAVLASPNMSSLVMAKIYPNPARQPTQVVMNSAEEELNALENGKVDAAIVPTPFVPRYRNASVMQMTEQMPGLTMTASSKVPVNVINKVRMALLEADQDKQGKEALAKLQFTRFIPVVPNDYSNLAQTLEGLWGY